MVAADRSLGWLPARCTHMHLVRTAQGMWSEPWRMISLHSPSKCYLSKVSGVYGFGVCVGPVSISQNVLLFAGPGSSNDTSNNECQSPIPLPTNPP